MPVGCGQDSGLRSGRQRVPDGGGCGEMYRENRKGKIPSSVEVWICGSAWKRDPGSFLSILSLSLRVSPSSGSSLDLSKAERAASSGLLRAPQSSRHPPSQPWSPCLYFSLGSHSGEVLGAPSRQVPELTWSLTAASPASPSKGPGTKWLLSKDWVKN